jgi:hypothetical protein
MCLRRVEDGAIAGGGLGHGRQLVAQANVQRQARPHLPLVGNEEAVAIFLGAAGKQESSGGEILRQSKNEICRAVL